MKRGLIILSAWIMTFFAPHSALYGQRKVSTLSMGWRFHAGQADHAYLPGFDDSGWEKVRVPHDWAIGGPFIKEGDGNTGKLPWKGEGWYRLHFNHRDTGKNVYLIFDGVMAFPKVYLNGQEAGSWDYGYNSFYLDITPWIKEGENLLAVHADTRKHDSRWYPGAGIYRKVQLVTVDPVHIAPWGTWILTPVVNEGYATVRIRSRIENRSGSEKPVSVIHEIFNRHGMVVATDTQKISVLPGKNSLAESNLTIFRPERWDINNPVRYAVRTTVLNGRKITDRTTTPFGVRTMRFTADHGFYLNGRRVQLHGVNLHHDQGPLGAAFHGAALERQLRIMQSMGVNAIRSSHNIPPPELAELCDSLGLLLFAEAFDKYDAKADILPETDFEEFALRNVKNFVMRDRNHPSIMIWSVGNEIRDVQANLNGGFRKLEIMVNAFRRYDPTRPVTMACDMRNTAVLRHFDDYDVHSWNYGRRYDLARQIEPNKAVIVSESGSTVSTRGYYEVPLPERQTDFSGALQVSSYDLNAPAWADLPDESFLWEQEEPYIAGEFVWTGFDYLGEPTPYNNAWARAHGLSDSAASRSSYFGIVDLCGIPKDRYYLYKSYWKPEETTVHILPHWNWEGHDGDTIPVFVYTNGDCAELYLNGRSLGKQCKIPDAEDPLLRTRLMWKNVRYSPGTLKAVAYREGRIIGTNTVKTAGPAKQLKATPNRMTLKATGEDLSFILLETFDARGNPCPRDNRQVQVSVSGPATLAGVGNGNPQSMEPFQSDRVSLFYGKAMIIIRSGTTPGNVTVTVRPDGLPIEKVRIKIIP